VSDIIFAKSFLQKPPADRRGPPGETPGRPVVRGPQFEKHWSTSPRLQGTALQKTVIFIVVRFLMTASIKFKVFALMMEAVSTSETSVNFNVTTQRYILEDSKLHVYIRRCQNLKSNFFSNCNYDGQYRTVETESLLHDSLTWDIVTR
jgi:hypothetical protein